MARIWDCDPSELGRKHLCAEHKELGQLFCDMQKGILGRRGRFTHHAEAKRFQGRYDLLVLRSDCLCREAVRRGYNFRQGWIDNLEHYRLIELDDTPWYELRDQVDWPTSYLGYYWTPWMRDRMTQEQYTMLGTNWSPAYKTVGKETHRPDPDPFNIPVLDFETVVRYSGQHV